MFIFFQNIWFYLVETCDFEYFISLIINVFRDFFKICHVESYDLSHRAIYFSSNEKDRYQMIWCWIVFRSGPNKAPDGAALNYDPTGAATWDPGIQGADVHKDD